MENVFPRASEEVQDNGIECSRRYNGLFVLSPIGHSVSYCTKLRTTLPLCCALPKAELLVVGLGFEIDS